MAHDIVGIGNALMDILVQVDDVTIQNLGLQKGVFNMVDEQKLQSILDGLPKDDLKVVPGGSVANTMAGVVNLGGSAAYYGRVGDDEHGNQYHQLMHDTGVNSQIRMGPGKTGVAVTLITPDTQRTFATHLGVATALEHELLNADDIRNAKILHFTGYQLQDKAMRDAVFKAIEIAQAAGVKVSFDVGDPNLCVRANGDVKEIIKKYVDIVFANEEESHGLMGPNPINALNNLSKMAEIAVVKFGKHGSFVKKGADVYHAEVHLAQAIDTTGAGDMYAAGFLYGLTNGYGIEDCANIASYAASKVVEVIGARLPRSLADDIKVRRWVPNQPPVTPETKYQEHY